VIVTGFPGQADLVRSLDAGLVVPPDHASALAKAMSALSANPPTPATMIRADLQEVGFDLRQYPVEAFELCSSLLETIIQALAASS
jgi:hypothetical protein